MTDLRYCMSNCSVCLTVYGNVCLTDILYCMSNSLTIFSVCQLCLTFNDCINLQNDIFQVVEEPAAPSPTPSEALITRLLEAVEELNAFNVSMRDY